MRQHARSSRAALIFWLLLLANLAWAGDAKEPCVDLLSSGKAAPHRGTLEHYILKSQKDSPRGDRVRNGEITPRFTNPQEEIFLARNKWRGVRGPRMLQELLPDDCTFIDHKLLGSAGDGIVKDAGSGEFVMLRCGMSWNNEWVGFNISVPVSTLVANLNRKERWLIGPEAEAIVDWGHGGGTKTTGNHTSIGLMGHLIKFGVATIAIDQPWHGEGPRTFFKDDIDYWAFRLALLDKFTHPDVPVIGVGHSMGGIFADMMMRRSDLRDLKLSKRYKAFIPLSSVVDLRPGASFRDKMLAEKWKEGENRTAALQHRIAPGDRDLGAALLIQDKISALSGVFVNFMNLFHDWREPGHKGREYLPSLFVWGDSDYLYVGNEDLIDSHLLNLKNVRLKVYGPRINFKGDVVQVGHLIFDHYRTIKDHPEAKKILAQYLARRNLTPGGDDQLRTMFFENFVKSHVSKHFWLNEDNRGYEALLIAAYYWDTEFQNFVKSSMRSSALFNKEFEKELKRSKEPRDTRAVAFAEKAGERAFMKQFVHEDQPETYTLVREEIERVLGKKLVAKKRDSGTALLANLLQAYSSNLAFREWALNTDIVVVTASEKFRALNEVAELIRTVTELNQKIAKTSKTAGGSTDESLQKLRQQLEQAQNDLALRLKAEKIMVNAMDSQDLQKEMQRINALRKRSFIPEGPQAETVRINVQKREQYDIEIQSMQTASGEKRKTLDRLIEERNSLETALHEISLLGGALEVNAAVKFSETLLNELIAADEAVRLSVEKYMVELVEQDRVGPGAFQNLPAELQAVFNAYDAASRNYQKSLQTIRAKTAWAAEHGHLGPDASAKYTRITELRREIDSLNKEINGLDGRVFVRKQLRNRLLEEWANQLVPGYISVERKKLAELMSVQAQDWTSILGDLQKAWSDWKDVWAERPPPDKVELY